MIRPGTGNDIIDGGENGQDPYTKELLSDVVMYDINYADYTIKSEDVGGVLTIKVTDNNSGDEDTITNVEVLQFMDRQIETGVVVNQKSVMKNEKILTGKDYKGSF